MERAGTGRNRINIIKGLSLGKLCQLKNKTTVREILLKIYSGLVLTGTHCAYFVNLC